jgi:hypothetical protein
MRLFLVTACAAVLVTGCESFNTKLDASRQDRCQRADWAQVGERDGVEGATLMSERYAHICGDLFSLPYQEGLQKGTARRPRRPLAAERDQRADEQCTDRAMLKPASQWSAA